MACEDVAEGTKCYDNVLWAKETGIKKKPQYYENFTTLDANSSFADFQCALSEMVGSDEAGTGWNCTKPCSSTLSECAIEKDIDFTTTTAASSSSSSFPVWAWILCGIGLLGIIGGLAYYFLVMKKEAPKKKKRATKTVAPKKEEPAPAPAAPEIPVITAPPVYVSTPQYATPVYSTPIATMTQAMPIATMAAPAMSSVVAMAQPVTTLPMQAGSFVGAAAPVTAFYS